MAIKLADTVEPMGDFPAVNSTDVNIDIDGTSKNLQDAFDDGDFGEGGGLPVVTELPQNPEDGDVVLITDYDQEKSGILQYHDIMYYAFKNTEHNMVLYTTTQELTWEMRFYVNDDGMVPYHGDYGLDQLDPNGEYFIIGLYIEGEFVNNLRFDHDSSLDQNGSDWHDISSGLKNYNVQIYRYMSEDAIKKLLPTIHDDEFILTVGCDYDWGTNAYYCSMGWYHPPGDHNYRYWTLNSGTMVYQFYEGWDGSLEFREYNLANPQIENAFKVVDDLNNINLGDTALFLLPPDTGTNYINGGIYKCVESVLIQKAGGSEHFYILLDDLGPSQGDILYNDYGLRVAVITEVDGQNETFTVRDEFGTVVNFNFSDISESTDRIPIYVAQGITDRCLPSPSDCTVGITLRYTGENYNDGNMDIKYNHVYECDIDDNDNKIFIDITPPDEEVQEALSVASTASSQASELEQNVALYNSYSLNETFTGGTWINGKKIYKKTYYMGAVPSWSSGTVFLRIPFDVDFETIVEMKGMIVPNSNSTTAQIEYYSIPKPPKVGQSSYNVSLKIKPYNNVLNLELETNSELNNKDAYATVYYTKVND